MVSQQSIEVARSAKAIYEQRLRATLEAEHLHRFVAIEPISGDHFVADSFSSAVQEARQVYPDRLPFVLRVGSAAAIHLGEMSL